MRKTKSRAFLYLILIFLLSVVLFFSLAKILAWKKDSDETMEEIASFEDVEIVELETTDEDLVDEETQENPYLDYTKISLLDVDFASLKSTNSETSGWIQVAGTSVNYPYVHHSDNKYYLTHSFSKKYNSAGWLFLDYRNKPDFSDQNTIIYAHGRADRTMFGSLRDLLGEKWQENPDNFIIKISTEERMTAWQIFSVYRIPTTSDYLRTNFSSEKSYTNFLDMLKSRSAFDFKTDVIPADHILTLSTCYNKEEKLVVHAKMVGERLI